MNDKNQYLLSAWGIDMKFEEDTPRWGVPFICFINSIFLLAWTFIMIPVMIFDKIDKKVGGK